jgi:hypothetical protein
MVASVPAYFDWDWADMGTQLKMHPGDGNAGAFAHLFPTFALRAGAATLRREAAGALYAAAERFV